MNSRLVPARGRGFTLVESILAITLLGVLGGMVAVFIRGPIQAYLDTADRAVLSDAADAAMRRIAREVQSSLPNSFRGTSGGSSACFEFLPVEAGGRYRVEKDSGNDINDDILMFNSNDDSFDVLGHRGLLASWPSGSRLVAIYNLGISGADAYAADNTAPIASVAIPAPGGAAARITLTAAKKFPLESPGRRFQVIPNYSVAYSCSGTSLYRSTQSISSGKLAACPSSGDLLATNVNCAVSKFEYAPAVVARNGVLTISLQLNAANGDTVRLYNQVGVSNVP